MALRYMLREDTQGHGDTVRTAEVVVATRDDL